MTEEAKNNRPSPPPDPPPTELGGLITKVKLPEGWVFPEFESKYLDKIEEIFKQVEDGDIFAPSGRELLEYQIELIKEVLDERKK